MDAIALDVSVNAFHVEQNTSSSLPLRLQKDARIDVFFNSDVCPGDSLRPAQWSSFRTTDFHGSWTFAKKSFDQEILNDGMPVHAQAAVILYGVVHDDNADIGAVRYKMLGRGVAPVSHLFRDKQVSFPLEILGYPTNFNVTMKVGDRAAVSDIPVVSKAERREFERRVNDAFEAETKLISSMRMGLVVDTGATYGAPPLMFASAKFGGMHLGALYGRNPVDMDPRYVMHRLSTAIACNSGDGTTIHSLSDFINAVETMYNPSSSYNTNNNDDVATELLEITSIVVADSQHLLYDSDWGLVRDPQNAYRAIVVTGEIEPSTKEGMGDCETEVQACTNMCRYLSLLGQTDHAIIRHVPPIRALTVMAHITAVAAVVGLATSPAADKNVGMELNKGTPRENAKPEDVRNFNGHCMPVLVYRAESDSFMDTIVSHSDGRRRGRHRQQQQQSPELTFGMSVCDVPTPTSYEDMIRKTGVRFDSTDSALAQIKAFHGTSAHIASPPASSSYSLPNDIASKHPTLYSALKNSPQVQAHIRSRFAARRAASDTPPMAFSLEATGCQTPMSNGLMHDGQDWYMQKITEINTAWGRACDAFINSARRRHGGGGGGAEIVYESSMRVMAWVTDKIGAVLPLSVSDEVTFTSKDSRTWKKQQSNHMLACGLCFTAGETGDYRPGYIMARSGSGGGGEESNVKFTTGASMHDIVAGDVAFVRLLSDKSIECIENSVKTSPILSRPLQKTHTYDLDSSTMDVHPRSVPPMAACAMEAFLDNCQRIYNTRLKESSVRDDDRTFVDYSKRVVLYPETIMWQAIGIELSQNGSSLRKCFNDRVSQFIGKLVVCKFTATPLSRPDGTMHTQSVICFHPLMEHQITRVLTSQLSLDNEAVHDVVMAGRVTQCETRTTVDASLSSSASASAYYGNSIATTRSVDNEGNGDGDGDHHTRSSNSVASIIDSVAKRNAFAQGGEYVIPCA